jgi:hypothetical protein
MYELVDADLKVIQEVSIQNLVDAWQAQ